MRIGLRQRVDRLEVKAAATIGAGGSLPANRQIDLIVEILSEEMTKAQARRIVETSFFTSYSDDLLDKIIRNLRLAKLSNAAA